MRTSDKDPFWSVMIPTYNCSSFLVETLNSVLQQAPEEQFMQIEVIDDCSLDDPQGIVHQIGKSRVSFFRQLHNVGISRNFNTCIQRAKGKWIHILHGDDLVLPDFYKVNQEIAEQNPEVGAILSRSVIIDENGVWKNLGHLISPVSGVLSNFIEILGVANYIFTPSIIVRKEVYEEIGGFNLNLSHTADWEMWQRIALNYSMWYEPCVISAYREHGKSDTSKIMRTGQNVKEGLLCCQIVNEQMPLGIKDRIFKLCKQHLSHQALESSYKFLQNCDLEASLAQFYMALESAPSLNSIISLLNSLVQRQPLTQPLLVEIAHCIELRTISGWIDPLISNCNLIFILNFSKSIESAYQGLRSVFSLLSSTSKIYNNFSKVTLFILITENDLNVEGFWTSLNEILLSLILELDFQVFDEKFIVTFIYSNELKNLLSESNHKNPTYRLSINHQDLSLEAQELQEIPILNIEDL